MFWVIDIGVSVVDVSHFTVVIVLLESWCLQRWYYAIEHHWLEWTNGTAWSVRQCPVWQLICRLSQSSWLRTRICPGKGMTWVLFFIFSFRSWNVVFCKYMWETGCSISCVSLTYSTISFVSYFLAMTWLHICLLTVLSGYGLS